MPDLRHAAAAVRAAIETTLVDECTITTDTDAETDDTLDPVTLELTADAPDALYEGPCSVSTRLQERNDTLADRAIVVRRLRVRLPATAPAVPVGATLTVTASTHAPDLIGRPLTVVDSTHHSLATSHQLTVEDRAGQPR